MPAIQTAFRSSERFTQTEFLIWLEEHGAMLSGTCELIGGSIVMAPPAGYPHSSVVTRLVFAMTDHVRTRELGQVEAPSAGYALPSGDTLEPDVSFLANASLARGPRPRHGEMFRIVPDLVVEVLSPSTQRYDRTEKKALYARNGVDEYWLVDTVDRVVTVFQRRGNIYDDGVEYREGEIGSRVLPALGLHVADVFAGIE
ncbi:MAG: Uma2 family endonuclease [Candidatus Binatia bacterium]